MKSKGTKSKLAHHRALGDDRPLPKFHWTHHGHKQRQKRRLWRVRDGQRDLYSGRRADCRSWMRAHQDEHDDLHLVPPDKSGQRTKR